jgi:hypothetical protein
MSEDEEHMVLDMWPREIPIISGWNINLKT